MSGCPFATLVWFIPAPVLRRCVFVIKDYRTTWILCHNKTSRATAQWYWFMTLPQCIVAPLFGLMEKDPIMGLLFGARVTATVVAGELDKRYRYQRIVGLSHLVTFGPLLGWLLIFTTSGGYWSSAKPDRNDWKGSFLWVQIRVMAVCLLLDIKDVAYQLAGYPYPCYIREAAIHQKLKVNDPRALKPVTWWNRIFGP